MFTETLLAVSITVLSYCGVPIGEVIVLDGVVVERGVREVGDDDAFAQNFRRRAELRLRRSGGKIEHHDGGCIST